MTLEAVALHHLDNLDAKLASFTQLHGRLPKRQNQLDAVSHEPGPQA